MTRQQPRNVQLTCDCGFTTRRTTAALATRGLALHSCDKYRTQLARAAAHAARMAAVDRTPQPCHHKDVTHEHGQYVTYTHDRCRCEPCSAAAGSYERGRTRRHAYGRFGNDWADAAPVRQHVRQLMESGVGLKRITKLTGINGGVLAKLMYGAPRADGTRRPPARRISVANADKLLTLQPGDPSLLAPRVAVDPTGTARRLQALVAIGWSQSKLSRRLGISPSNFTASMYGTRQVRASRAAAVRALYDELWNTLPPRDDHRDKIAYTRATRHAAAHGWAPPLAWDDDTIDDPTAQPFTDTEQRPGGKRVHVEDIEFLLDDQPLATAAQLAHRLRVSKDAIQYACRRAGRTDLLERLARNADLRGAAA